MTPLANSSTEIPSNLAEQEIQFLCSLAEHCGKMAADMRASVGVHEKAGPTDLVTDADLAVSTFLLKELSARFPKDFLISEEEIPPDSPNSSQRVWYIDPIDGTDNYVSGDGQYAVMLGLLVNGKPHFGCVHSPANNITYYGGPGYGSWMRTTGKGTVSDAEAFNPVFEGDMEMPVRLMMGFRDRKKNPWVVNLSGMKLISAGSVGLKVAKVINDEADLFVHLSGKLKYWDTVGPVAIALAAGLEVGTLEHDDLKYPLDEVRHPSTIVIGRRGCVAWARNVIGKRFFA
jgi:3'(2'), 5'-bisphosphate nucleotidase